MGDHDRWISVELGVLTEVKRVLETLLDWDVESLLPDGADFNAQELIDDINEAIATNDKPSPPDREEPAF